MLATQCSFCKHENKPGARFCADCGSPMHLKVCANPGCGKVSDVSATICETCGVPFPQIKLFDPAAATSEVHVSESLSYTEAAEKPRVNVWPLIAVALVAGSLPLLWANRDRLPAPKTGPFSRPAIPAPSVAPVALPAPVMVAPPAAPAAVAPPPLAPTPAVPPAPVSASELDPAGPAATRPASKKPAATVKPKAVAKAPAKKAEPASTCTEAVAALGLCDPKQVRK